MNVELVGETGETKNLRELVKCNEEIYKQAKREHRKWFPDSKCELDFGFE